MDNSSRVNKKFSMKIAVTVIAICFTFILLSGCGHRYKRRFPPHRGGGGGCHFVETGESANYQHHQMRE